MILVVSICKESLHNLEFVKPIEDILEKNQTPFSTIHYKKLRKRHLKKAEKVIICGTSLKDNDFLADLEKFSWINDFRRPILGICGGSHIMGLLQGKKLEKNFEIGLKEIKIHEDFLGVEKGETLQVYHLHGFSALPEIYQRDNYYATTFHPEVRNKNLVETFVKLQSDKFI
jgi:GMP synthase (glutamine-hydrolysing)